MATQKLNPPQTEAVQITTQPLLVLAGAGSGKTRVITEKIAYLVQQGFAARNIAALTFTNKAAREMKQRVDKLLPAQKSRGLRVSTFHALGLEILRREHKTLGYKASMSLFDDADKKNLLKNLIQQNLVQCDLEAVNQYAAQIGTWKNAFITPEQALQQAAKLDLQVIQLYKIYVQHLKAYNAVDFDDLILLPVLLFQQAPEILQQWRNRIRYLLVDEYQDTNITQYALVRSLAGNLGNFTVVGDDDQSIYAWRGAQPENLSQLQTDYPRLKVIKLEQNYRSRGRILQVANQLIAKNPHKFEKKLWSALILGDKLRVLAHKDERVEAQQIVSELIYHKFRLGSKYSDYAILYRSNHQSRLFEQQLRVNNVPYFISGGTSFFAYTEVKDVLAYLRLLVNPDDDAAFLRIINTPRREIGAATVEKLGSYANKRHISLFAASFELGLNATMSKPAVTRLQKFTNWMLATAAKIEVRDNFTVIESMLEQIGYAHWLRENSKTPEAAKRQQNNVNELLAWLKKLGTSDETGQTQPLAEIVAKIMLLDILERQDDNEAGEQVSLMTLHAAKGLEFRHVFLIGMEENLLPHKNSLETGSIEEERRLAYVGITRAQHSCTFSYCTHRKLYGEVYETQASRFLNELPIEDLDWAAKNPDPNAARKAGADFFAARKKNNIL